MSAESLWNAVRGYTAEVVRTTNFGKIVDAVPYFENWWHSELAWRFNDSASRYRLAGFDVPALPKATAGSGLFPDLLLDVKSGDAVEQIVWLQLKQLNLQRRVDTRDGKNVRLKTALNNLCKSFCADLVATRNIDLAKTAELRFQSSMDLQQQTLLPIYRQRPLELFRSASHLAAVFMLAAFPAHWSDDYTTTLERSIRKLPSDSASLFQRTELIYSWRSDTSEMCAYLTCLASPFN